MSLVRSFRWIVYSALVSLGLVGAARANNVEAAVEGSLLTVFGDNASNQISISRNSVGDVVVGGLNGTTVNGVASVRFPRLSLNAAEVRMGDGDDRVTLRGIRVANDLFVDLGPGADRLVTGSPIFVGANLAIEGGLGNDVVRLTDATVGEDLGINGGVGVLNVALASLLGGKSVTLIGDDAHDVFSVTNSDVAELLAVESKGGNDRVTVSGVAADGLLVSTDIGVDVVRTLDVMTVGSIGIFTGPSGDSVTLDTVASGQSITVSVDDGHDTVHATDVAANVDAVFEGGAGADTLTDLGITAGANKVIKEFETILP